MDSVATVLAAYPRILRPMTIVPLGSRGGFSGARLWRLETAAGALCLRAAAASESRPHLIERHALMARARTAGLHYVPAVISTRNGRTVVEAAGSCWELMEWMPGRADFQDFPTPARLKAAVSALAQLHQVWQPPTPVIGPVPAIGRRLEIVRSTNTEALTLPRNPLLGPLAERARRFLIRRLPEAPRLLLEWESFNCPLQACLRDVWHDNLLFEGDALTGLVDYAGTGLDSVAADLARMLGSLIGDDDDRWSEALEIYRVHRPVSPDEERLSRVLDRTGVIGAVGNWLRWLCEPGREFEETAAAVGRIEKLLQRVEKW